MEQYNKVKYNESKPLFENREEREWLLTSEAAEYLRISPNALRILVCRGRVKYFKLGRHLRFHISDLKHLVLKGIQDGNKNLSTR